MSGSHATIVDEGTAATEFAVREICGWREFLKLGPAWDALAAADADALLLGHAWAATSWRCGRARADGERLRILALADGDGLRALLPLRHHPRTRRLCFLGEGTGQRMDRIADPSSEAWLTLLAWLRQRRDWDRLDLQNLRAASAVTAAAAAAAHGLAVQTRGEVQQRRIRLDRSWGELEAGFSPYLRANFRRRLKRLQARAQVSLELQAHTAGLAARLGECFELERKGWKGQRGTAMLDRPELNRFYRRLAGRMAAHGRLRLYALRLGERLIAFEYCLADPVSRRLYSLKIAYDEEFRTASPGTVLRWMLLQSAERQFDAYEFLGDDAPWKKEWTSETTELRHLRIFNRTLGGRAWRLRGRLAPWLQRIRRPASSRWPTLAR